MTSTHIHLLLNHVAIMAAVFSVFVFVFGLFRKNSSIINVALTGFVVAALVAIPVFLTGEPAEESVEHLPGVVESVIEEHEEAAELSIWLIEITGIAALGGLLLRSGKFFNGKVFYGLMVLLALASSAGIAYTGYLGGMIRHTELNAGTAGTQNVPGENMGAPEAGEETEDDD